MSAGVEAVAVSKTGERLLAHMATTTRAALVVAPFMKVDATRQILAAIPATVRDVTLVSRWTTEEVASGVSDLEVLDLVAKRAGARLMLHPALHGKLYVADDRALVGSANATGRALGWHANPNLELLVPHPIDAHIESFLAELFANASAATSALRQAMAEAASRMRDEMPPRLVPWLPRYASPYHLWHVYDGVEAPGLMRGGREDARSDLSSLRVPAGLEHAAFLRLVHERFMVQPVVARIAGMLGQGLGDEAAEPLLRAEVPHDHLPHGSASAAWEILKRWYTTFGGDQFRVRPTGEELVRSPLL